MRIRFILTVIAALAISQSGFASDRPEVFDFQFTYVADGSKAIPDDGVLSFFLGGPTGPEFLQPGIGPTDLIAYLELEVTGLNHDKPWDLSFLLFDPGGLKTGEQGSGVIVMEDSGFFGSGFELSEANGNTTLLFADKGIPLPTLPTDVPLQGRSDTIYAPGGQGNFSQYIGLPIGSAPWFFAITDDTAGVVGSFETVTLRGVIVPEPATLSLLAIGALAMLRRRR